jgi:surfeit locus 1 family protein
VPPERADPSARAQGQLAGPVLVTGLLRISEPHGGFLRRNDPQGNRWYSRDVTAIAETRNLTPGLTAPYFIDADATPNPGGLPVGGLTVIAFPNSHLVYALTWYGLALLVAFGFAYAAREEWRIRGGARVR